MDYIVHGILQARILEWSCFLLQEIFPTQGLLHWRWIPLGKPLMIKMAPKIGKEQI